MDSYLCIRSINPMYQWRKMTDEEKKATLAFRRKEKRPWHSPKHKDFGPGTYLITGACYEHRPILGSKTGRMRECAEGLRSLIAGTNSEIAAWCVLPNHYHFLIYTEDLTKIFGEINLFHGRKSRLWNLEDGTRGRKVFYNFLERFIPSEDRFRISVNSI